MKILIVVDMQNDFITGSVANSSAKQIIAAMTKKIDKYLQEGYEVIYTQDTHQEDYLETQEGKLLPVEHCKQNTHGWEIHDAVRREECTVLQKNGFGSL